MAHQDQRILFNGLLDREEILQIQRASRLLVNPRRGNQEFTKYSFPSKLLEYMSSGTPVLSFRLPGIPPEYEDYLFWAGEERDSLYEALVHLVSKPNSELEEMGRRARNFVRTHKSATAQAAKILHMIRYVWADTAEVR